jgi:hypothetical protein
MRKQNIPSLIYEFVELKDPSKIHRAFDVLFEEVLNIKKFRIEMKRLWDSIPWRMPKVGFISFIKK